MKINNSSSTAFTLIELLVVISIMMILAALVIPVGGIISKQRKIARTRAEMQRLVLAIENYKIKLGHYPPDNPSNLNLNQLYYELVGTTLNANTYTTKDGRATIAASAVPTTFGPTVGGFINCTKGAGSDEGTLAQNFLPGIKADNLASTNGGPYVLVASVGSGTGNPPAPNPWHYVSTNPTNSPRSFDLWVDLKIGSKTNRICNWSDRPLVL